MDTTIEIGIIVSGSTDVLVDVFRDTKATIVEGDCLIFFIPTLGNIGLFSVPAPSIILVVFDGVFYLPTRNFFSARTLPQIQHKA